MGNNPLKLFFSTLFLILFFTQQASASLCSQLLSSTAKPEQIHILIEELRSRKLEHLLAVLQGIQIVEKPKRYFWQNTLSWKVQRLTGQVTITSRLTEWNSEEEKMKDLWNFANILYQARLHQTLWNLQKIKGQLQLHDTTPLDLSMNGSDEELLPYFLAIAPEQWSKEWVENLKGLNSDLYTLLATQDIETIIQLLPKKDPGRHKYRAFFFGLFVSYNPMPNQEDFATFQKQNGSQSLNSILDKRYLRQTYLSWYTNFLKRFFMASLLASSIPAWSLAIQEAPRVYQYISNYSEHKKQIQDTLESLTDQEKLQKAYEKNLEQIVLKKYSELVLEINKLKASQSDNARLEELEEDLAELIKKYNTILKLPNPSSP